MLHLRLLSCSKSKGSEWSPRFEGFARFGDLLQATQLVKGDSRITGQAVHSSPGFVMVVTHTKQLDSVKCLLSSHTLCCRIFRVKSTLRFPTEELAEWWLQMGR